MKEDKMTDRGFEMVSASDPTDQFHRVRIRCSHKGCTATMIFSRRGVINPVHAAKWFRDKGWHVSGHKNADLCPEHTKGGESMKRGPKPRGGWESPDLEAKGVTG
jgi:nitrite reductase/ring-hydroxylating ferredoxin subunit